MKIEWRSVAHFAAGVLGGFIPNAVAIEQGAEDILDAKTGTDKAEAAVRTAINGLNTATALSGKTLMTPRIEAVMHRLNDDSVELLNALAEAHKASLTQ